MDSAQTILDILLSQGVLNQDQVANVKLEQLGTGKKIEDILMARGLANSMQIAAARASMMGIQTVVVSKKPIAQQLLTLIPQSLASRYNCLPFDISPDGTSISLAMEDPTDLVAIEFIEKRTGLKVLPFLANVADLKIAIDEHYSQNLSSQVTAVLDESPTETSTVKSEGTLDLEKEKDIIRDAPVAKIVSSILEFAIKSRASDIHVEPLEDKTRVRYRIDGILQEKLILPTRVHEALVSRVKILSELKIDEKRIPQDGRFNYKMADNEVDIRVSTLPTVHGEKMVLRLLRKSGGVPTLVDLGLRGMAMKNLEISMLRPHGVIVVCGPTGSGKTTTLYAVLSKINSTKVNIVTVEDPVEYQISGVNQVQINPQAGLTFASALRSFLRQDPNIILVGEIRDSETTELAIQAALTGHLVFSTVHTSNASGALPRLLDLGAEPFLLSSSLNAVVGQRIVRKICPHCKESYEPPEMIVADIKQVLGNLLPPDKIKDGKLELFKGKGCDECGSTGFLGRVGIFEVLPVSDKISKMILTHSDANDIERQAKEEGMITMKEDGYLKAVEGVTTIEEVLRVAQD